MHFYAVTRERIFVCALMFVHDVLLICVRRDVRMKLRVAVFPQVCVVD